MSEQFDVAELRSKSRGELEELGCQLWSEDSGLLLFPGRWYDENRIPANAVVTSISGETTRFEECSGDRRFGYLAYGVVPDE